VRRAAPAWATLWASRWAERDRVGAQAMHRIAAWPLVVSTLVMASRLGDGPLWYLLIALLPLLDPRDGSACALQMLGVGVLNLLIYRVLKRRVGRPRPFVACPEIRACTAPLDAFSFPSGHTLHAMAFAIVLAFHYPLSALVTGPFVLLVAASRMVLGLHYPSDVAVGAAIGLATSLAVLLVN